MQVHKTQASTHTQSSIISSGDIQNRYKQLLIQSQQRQAKAHKRYQQHQQLQMHKHQSALKAERNAHRIQNIGAWIGQLGQSAAAIAGVSVGLVMNAPSWVASVIPMLAPLIKSGASLITGLIARKPTKQANALTRQAESATQAMHDARTQQTIAKQMQAQALKGVRES